MQRLQCLYMKINFSIDKNNYAEYCLACNSENSLEHSSDESGLLYTCSKCGKSNSRALIIDPEIDWYMDDDGEYVHKSVGVFIIHDGRVLVFKRTKFPFGYTIPAGHVDKNESSEVAAVREVREETGLNISQPELIFEGMIEGDSCRRGSDLHSWSAYRKRVTDLADLDISAEEGTLQQWVTYKELLTLDVPPAMRYLLENIDITKLT